MRLAPWVMPVLLFAACGEHNPVDVTTPGAFPITTLDITGGLVLSGRIMVHGDTLRGTLYLQNPTADTAWVEYGACSVGLRLYDAASRAGEPTGYNRLPGNAACIDIGFRKGVPPARQDSIVALAVQGQTLPDVAPGHYWFSLVTASATGIKHFVPAGDGNVP